MMNSAISLEDKSILIFNHKNKMDKYWNTYSMELITQITATERLYNHQIQPSEKGRLTVNLFGCVNINIVRSQAFGEVKIDFQIESEELSGLVLPPACIDGQGQLDHAISVNDKAGVFAHYLQRLQIIYDTILALSQDKA
ncbi:hypothetical protein [Kluyvera genomosp. 1]|uniref:hypothetical protein n=1 Tax=Kluyvera genomosp. 1 TaxID=2774053 RepID=UPI00068C48CE|nr:hypothetical protein [Kluyvera genomosp. 1]